MCEKLEKPSPFKIKIDSEKIAHCLIGFIASVRPTAYLKVACLQLAAVLFYCCIGNFLIKTSHPPCGKNSIENLRQIGHCDCYIRHI